MSLRFPPPDCGGTFSFAELINRFRELDPRVNVHIQQVLREIFRDWVQRRVSFIRIEIAELIQMGVIYFPFAIHPELNVPITPWVKITLNDGGEIVLDLREPSHMIVLADILLGQPGPILVLHNLERFRALNRNEDVLATDVIGQWVQGGVIHPEDILDIEFLDAKPTAKVTGLLVYDLDDDDDNDDDDDDDDLVFEVTGEQLDLLRASRILRARLRVTDIADRAGVPLDVLGGHQSILRTDEVRTQPFGPNRVRGLIRRGEETTLVEEPPMQSSQPFNLLRALTERAERYGVLVSADDFDRDDSPPPRRGPRPPPLVIPPRRRLRDLVGTPVDNRFFDTPPTYLHLWNKLRQINFQYFHPYLMFLHYLTHRLNISFLIHPIQ